MPTILIRESDSPEGPWTEIAVTPIEHIRELVTFTDRNPELAEAAKAGDAQARRLLARLSKTTERIRDELEQFGPAPQAVHHFVALEPELMRRIAALKKALIARNRRLGLRCPFDSEALVPRPERPPARGRPGPRLMVKPEDSYLVRVPTSKPAQQALAILGRGVFRPVDGADAVMAQLEGTQVRVECPPELGFTPDLAIRALAKHGPAVVQTFLGLCGLWILKRVGNPYDTKLEACASDLLRFMGRKPTSRGGFTRDELLAQGRAVYILMQTSVLQAFTSSRVKGATNVTVEIGRLADIEGLSVQLRLPDIDPDPVQAVVHFRYSLSRDTFDWLCGEHPQYAHVSGRLLRYHPEREKYQVLLGFALVYHDKVNRKRGGPNRSLRLRALLNLAAVDIPARNPARFLKALCGALKDLAQDGVIPGVTLALPDGRGLNDDGQPPGDMSARDFLAQAIVAYPALLSPAPQAALPPSEAG